MRFRNYLRVRGEYACRAACLAGMWELPPRARRIQHMKCFTAKVLGTTSACAENTGLKYFREIDPGNYLRVRGEYRFRPAMRGCGRELPPRARRIPSSWYFPTSSVGTTSACAENTDRDALRDHLGRNYLRVRGEYMKNNPDHSNWVELPPRARRILENPVFFCSGFGTTSACAENTLDYTRLAVYNRNYLRVRGEYSGRANKKS